MRDFLGTPGRLPHQAIMGIDAFGEQPKVVEPAFHLELAFFVRLLQPEMQGGQVERRGTSRHAGALAVGGEQLVVAQGLSGLAGKAMQPVEQLLQLVDDFAQLDLIDAFALPQPFQMLALAIQFGDQLALDIAATQGIENFKQMRKRGTGFPGGAPMHVVARLGENEFQAQELADAFIEGMFEMHDS